MVHGAGTTIKALVDDILDVAKMTTGNLTVESVPYDLKQILVDAARLWTDQAAAKGVAFTLELGRCPGLIQGDPARVRQIVFNLLANALKFTAQGRMSLSASCDGDQYSLVVADTGIGIAPDKLEEIFESFRQADAATTRRFGGTGLGLAICRNLARAMGGDVTVASEPGQGSAFTVTLPLVDATPAAAPDRQRREGGETVLIVQPNPIQRAMLKALFEPHAELVVPAATLEEGIGLLSAGGIERALVDGSAVGDEPDGASALARLAALAAAAGARTALLWRGVPPTAIVDAGMDQILLAPLSGSVIVSCFYAADALRTAEAALVPRAA